jgi:uncharacterized membrane protein YgcG
LGHATSLHPPTSQPKQRQKQNSTPIFESVNAGDQGSALLSTVLVGVVFVVATFIAIGLCDKLGRRPLFQSSGLVCMACMAGVGGLLATYMNPVSGGVENLHAGRAIISLICIYVAAFGWGWGPLAWLAPSELTPLEARAAGTALAVVSNHIVCFFVGQFFLSMMCKLQWGASTAQKGARGGRGARGGGGGGKTDNNANAHGTYPSSFPSKHATPPPLRRRVCVLRRVAARHDHLHPAAGAARGCDAGDGLDAGDTR